MRVVLIAVSAGTLLLVPIAQVQASPRPHYGGVGIRAGLRDEPALVLGLRFQLASADALSLSLRPAVLVASSIELRVSLTVDAGITGRLQGYAGVGAAYNESGSRRLDPMLSGEADFTLLDRLGLHAGLNHLFQPRDGDTEFTALAWSSFGGMR